ncbi:hypothetical protein LZ32DRAFT_611434 [Colletotrichum eremochloae]|nr:hypothetical protein LZ32DRAFT_611434 [Colletotrichum eremochloae]
MGFLAFFIFYFLTAIEYLLILRLALGQTAVNLRLGNATPEYVAYWYIEQYHLGSECAKFAALFFRTI